jgi:hypothetical protein
VISGYSERSPKYMKRITPFLLPLLFLTVIASAQPLSLLTNLHPRPKVSFLRSNTAAFDLSGSTKIVIGTAPSAGTLKAIGYLQEHIRRQLGDTIAVINELQYHFEPNVIMVGQQGEYSYMLVRLLDQWPAGDTLPSVQGYVLDVSEKAILVWGADSNGQFYGISTLIQLLDNSQYKIPALHINDWPDYPIRWVFSQHNLQVPANCAVIAAIEDTMAAHKLNGLQQNDFKNNILEQVPSWYFTDVDSIHRHSRETNVELIPGVCDIGYSEGILFHDPDLAEGIPTTSTYYIEDDTGRLITDPNMILPNGGFENVSNGQFSGWSFYDGPKVSALVDSTTVHSGRYSAQCTNFAAGNGAGNCRFNKLLNCQPFHSYHMSVWIKTQGFRGTFQLLAIGINTKGASQTLTFTEYPVAQTTNGWQQYHVVFNTAKWDQVYVYCGVWSGSAGTIWFDDFQIEDAGMTNMLRRSSELPTVTRGTTTYVEGRDYTKLIDNAMEQSAGSYPWHTSPSFKLASGSTIHNGDSVQVHFIRANPVLNYQNGDGSTMVCVSEDTLYSILHDQISRVEALHHPNRYMMGHDEIRVMNWDDACTKRQQTPAVLLADNLTKCDSIINQVHPDVDRFVWSDMFDSLHNAHNNYYLVNGDLSGDWDLIPKNVTIVNWNGRYLDTSLDFFARHGFKQITSPYYDEHDTHNIREWRKAMNRVPEGVRGMMYTTWSSDYSYLTPFADYAWSAGPMIVHEPFDSSGRAKISRYEYLPIDANLFPDPYDATDGIKSATYREYRIVNGIQRIDSIRLQKKTGSIYEAITVVDADPRTDIEYQIEVTNNQGIIRRTPKYFLYHIVGNERVNTTSSIVFSVYPNPAQSYLEFSLPIQHFELVNSLGICVMRESLPSSRVVDIHTLPAGTYQLRARAGADTFERSFIIVR